MLTTRIDTLPELQNLEIISLWGNNITAIGENVFQFYEAADYLRMILDHNKLNESSFHPNSGISRAGRKTDLNLNYNYITTLPAPIFETFLDAHPSNILELYGNPLICDERLSWIKSRRDEPEFQARVTFANCDNDPGYTVFNSNLIP